MNKRIQSLALVVAAGALLAVPAVGNAHHKPGHTKGGGSLPAKCVVNKGFVVKGTLVSYTADNPTTTLVDEESVTLTVTKMNRHARRSGLTDVDNVAAGTQYRINASGTGADPFTAQLSGYEPNETPGAGDKVRVIGKVAVTKRRCEPNASLEDRYDAVNVRKVKIVDAD